MNVFARAVITGFGMSLGSALYKRVSKRFGLDDGGTTEAKPDEAVNDSTDSTDDSDTSEPPETHDHI